MPPPSAINVLVYSGSGASAESVRHCLSSLRRLLSPYFAVSTLTASALLKEPWTTSCALLVFPGGADLPYCREFNGDGNRRIAQYVRKGGAYLGFCAGGYYGSARCEFEENDPKMAVVGSRELAFFPGTCRGTAFKGFEYQSEKGARAASLKINVGEQAGSSFKSYFNGGGVFVDAKKMADKGVEVLAEYEEDLEVDSGEGKAAIVYCKVGQGNVVLTGPHPEFAAANLKPENGGPAYQELIDTLAKDDDTRNSFLRSILSKLGLTLPAPQDATPSLSEIHFTSEAKDAVKDLTVRLNSIVTDAPTGRQIIGENDTFVLCDGESHPLCPSSSSLPPGDPEDLNKIPKRLVIHESCLPFPFETPNFNHSTFYSCLRSYRAESRSSPTQFGTFLLYGETVTSTNTLLEKNPTLLEQLPSGTVFAAGTQLLGRGRGGNSWVAPKGSLLFSLYLQHSMAHTDAPVIFMQYLVALAIAKAIRGYTDAHTDFPVHLKWPNDIYVQHENSFSKICGILINTSYSGSEFRLVIGAGVNVSNAAPTTSLNAVLAPINDERRRRGVRELELFESEKLLARICVVFEEMYGVFCRVGFAAFREEYYRLWLHTGQTVTVETEGGVRAVVRGITEDWGLLEVEEEGTGRRWALQSDGNSFDFFKGLIKRKI